MVQTRSQSRNISPTHVNQSTAGDNVARCRASTSVTKLGSREEDRTINSRASQQNSKAYKKKSKRGFMKDGNTRKSKRASPDLQHPVDIVNPEAPTHLSRRLIRLELPTFVLRKRKRRHFDSSDRTYAQPSSKTRGALRFLKTLHIPTLPSESNTWSSRRCRVYLGWRILNGPLRKHYSPPDGEVPTLQAKHSRSRRILERTGAPCITVSPEQSVANPLVAAMSQTHRKLLHTSLQIPQEWEPLRGIPVTRLYHKDRGVTNSEHTQAETSDSGSSSFISESGSARRISLRNSPEQITLFPPAQQWDGPSYIVHTATGQRTLRIGDPEIAGYTMITYHGGEHTSTSLRHNWEMLALIEPSVSSWRYQDFDTLERRDSNRHAGNIAHNDQSANLDIHSSGAIARFLSTYIPPEVVTENELAFRTAVSRLFSDVISSDTLPAHCAVRLSQPIAWNNGKVPPRLDVVCVPTRSALPWSQGINPVLLAAQYSKEEEYTAVEQLADAFHSSLVLFILYYLDVRKSSDEPLPLWMVLYGIIYTDNGCKIQAYYPSLRSSSTHDHSSDGPFSWGATSSIAASFDDIFNHPPYRRNDLVAALLRIHSHARGILQRLADWDGFKRVKGTAVLRRHSM